MWYLYLVENKLNGNLYVGITNNIKRRFRKHKNNSESKPLNAAIKKYGVDNFIFQISQYLESEDVAYEMEKYWIERLRNDGFRLYNIAEGGKGSGSGENHYLFGKHHTEETRNKMSKSHTGKTLTEEHKKNIGKSSKGRRLSEEAKTKISQSKIGKALTSEHKIKIGKSSKGRQHSLETKNIISEHNSGENNPSSKLTDDSVKQILTLWFSIEKTIRNKIGYKQQFYKENIENVFNIKMITLYEYLRGAKRKNIYALFV
jgi:group I intron endonuclease